MNPKTETTSEQSGKQPSFPNKFILQIVLLTLLVLATIVLIEHVGLGGRSAYRSHLQIDSPLVLPWLPAVDPFSGLSRVPSLPPTVRFYMLAGLLLTFVICPTIFLFGWRRRRLQRMTESAPGPVRTLTWSSLAYMFCGTLTIAVGIGVIPYAVLRELRNRTVCDNNEARLLRSHVQNEIHVAVADAFQFRLLPKALGGGGGSYGGYVLPEKIARTDHAEYSVAVQADTIEVRAESAFCATDFMTTKVNENGQTVSWLLHGNWGSG